MKAFRMFIAAGIFGFAACTTPTSAPKAASEVERAADLAADLAAIRAHGERWKTLYEAGDIEAMRDLYTPDAVLMTHGAPKLVGVDAILAHLARLKEAGGRAEIDFAEESLEVDGDRADLVSKYWMTIYPPAEASPIEAAGRSWLTFRRGGDGIWRLWRDMDNQAADVHIAQRPQSPSR